MCKVLLSAMCHRVSQYKFIDFWKNTLPPSSGYKIEVVSFYCTLLNLYQNARRCILQDILHSVNSSGNISVNSGEIYLPVLSALYALNVNNWCTFLVSGEAENSLVNYEILRIL
jgi:hypothetical protein